MAHLLMPMDVRVSVKCLAIVEMGRPIQNTHIQLGDVITAARYAHGGVRLQIHRGKTLLHFKIQADEGSDPGIRSALWGSVCDVLTWPVECNSPATVFDDPRLFKELFPDYDVSGCLQSAGGNCIAMFVVKSVKRKPLAA